MFRSEMVMCVRPTFYCHRFLQGHENSFNFLGTEVCQRMMRLTEISDWIKLQAGMSIPLGDSQMFLQVPWGNSEWEPVTGQAGNQFLCNEDADKHAPRLSWVEQPWRFWGFLMVLCFHPSTMEMIPTDSMIHLFGSSTAHQLHVYTDT